MRFKNLLFVIIFLLLMAAIIVVPCAIIKPKVERQIQQKVETVEGLVSWYEKDFNDSSLKWQFEDEYDRSRWLEKYKLASNSFCFAISHNRIEGELELLFDLEFNKGFRRYFSIHLLKKTEYMMYSSTHEFQELAKLKTLLSKLAEFGIFHQIPGLPQHIRQQITELTGYF